MSLIKALLLADNDKSKVDFIEAQIWTVNSLNAPCEILRLTTTFSESGYTRQEHQWRYPSDLLLTLSESI